MNYMYHAVSIQSTSTQGVPIVSFLGPTYPPITHNAHFHSTCCIRLNNETCVWFAINYREGVTSAKHEVQAQLLTCLRPDSQTLTWSKPLREKGEK